MTNRSLLFSAILLSATAMASLAKATYIPLTPTLGGNSAYTLSEITDEQAQGKSNVFVHYELGADNQLISHYYQYDIKPDVVSHPRVTANPNGADINGHFLNIKTVGYSGGAIFANFGDIIGNITGDFIQNQADNTNNAAAISIKSGSSGDITGDFIGNVNTSLYYSDKPGAIDAGHTGNIRGNFIGNETQGDGGAIRIEYEKSAGNISADIIVNNKAERLGGFLFLSASSPIPQVGNITANAIIGNKASQGGAIYNGGDMGNIMASVIAGNKAESYNEWMPAAGGFLYQNPYFVSTKTTQVTADLIIDNQAIGNFASGGAIYNVGTLNAQHLLLSANLVNNIAQGIFEAKGGAVSNYNRPDGMVEGFTIDGNQNQMTIYWPSHSHWSFLAPTNITITDSLFNGNKTIATQGSAYGGAIANEYYLHSHGHVMDISSQEQDIEQFLTEYQKRLDEGDIYSIHQLDTILQKPLLNLTNVSFLDNSAEGSNEAKGGAIYSESDVNITADGTTSLFRGNKANGKSNAIYMAIPKLNFDYCGSECKTDKIDVPYLIPTLTLSSVNGGIIEMDDGIDGDAGYKIALSGDASGTINFGGLISNASEITVSDVTVNFNKEQEGLVYNQQSGTANLNAAFNNSSLTVGEAVAGISSKASSQMVMNIADGSYLNGNNSLIVNSGMVNIGNLDNNLHFNKLAMNGGSLAIENVGVDLATQVMGSLSADSYDHQEGTIAVKNVNVTADGSAGTTGVNFTDSLIADKVVNQVTETMGPVWKYDVAYNSQTGEFEFSRPETPGGDDVNPEVMAPVVAAASTVAVLNDEIYSRVLGDVDVLGRSTPHVSSSDRSIKNAWVKTFGSKDSVDLKNFRGADTKFYGFIGGLSSDRINEGHGWSAIYSVYGAYAGGEQKFAGEKVTNNGGYLGLGANFYNGDFFIGATVNGGLIRNRSDKTGVDGKDKFNSYVGGIAGKTGYDYHIGSFTIEPNAYASYTVIGADDYMTKSGAKVEFGKMGVIEAAPGLKLSQDFGEGLKGYVSGRYVWTFTEGDHVKANQFDLPDVELEDYAEYGIGLEKNWHGSSGFVEVKRRDGGRNGWNFIAGYKTAF